MKQQSGFSLIEFIIFITTCALLVSAITTSYTAMVGTQTNAIDGRAMMVAKKRMEVLINHKRNVGFSQLTDPCTGGSPFNLCTADTDFTVTTTITPNYLGNSSYKLLQVNVTGKGQAELVTLVTEY